MLFSFNYKFSYTAFQFKALINKLNLRKGPPFCFLLKKDCILCMRLMIRKRLESGVGIKWHKNEARDE